MALISLLSLCLLVPSVLADSIQIRSSPVTLALAININSTGGARGLLNRDRARAKALFAHGQAKANGRIDDALPILDVTQTYTASVGVGKGTYTLIVDTGSSNTWVGAGLPYKPGPYSQDTGTPVTVLYGSGNFSGEEFLDDVTLGSATIRSQSIGVANISKGFEGFDGILGIGPVDLTNRTTSDNKTIPTVTDNLFSQGVIENDLVAASFAPTTALNESNGQLDFGAVDNSKFTGYISYVPITKISPASRFWGVEQTITYGAEYTPILNNTAGIVDTGTTLVLLATDAFRVYQKATGATFDNNTGLLTVADVNTLQSLFFHIGETTYELTANAQLWPRQFNSQIDGAPGQAYLVVNDLGTFGRQGLDFINGFTFLQRFYSVYDTANKRVGLATTSHTFDTTN